MAQLIEFAGNHLLLVSAFVGVLAALVFTFVHGGGAYSLSPQRAVLLLNHEDALPIDVRPEANFQAGHIINAIHLTQPEIDAGAARLNKHKERPLLVYCESGSASAQAQKGLKRAGHARVYRLQGGLAAWRGENLPLQTRK